MKKNSLLSTILVCVFSLSALAQNTSFGPKFGVNIANIKQDPSDETAKSLTGINAGVFITQSVTDDFGLTGEITYSGKGNSSKILNTTYNTKLGYLDIPVYGSYYFLKGNFRPKLVFGGYYSALLSAKLESNGNNLDIKSSIASSDYGFLLGGGAHIKLAPKSKSWLVVDVRYTVGLADIDTVNNLTSKNRCFSINFAYTFPLGNFDTVK